MSSGGRRLEGSVALVTGGGQGIGRGIALALLEAGATVFICGRTVPKVPACTASKCAEFVVCDVRDAGAVSRMFDQIRARGRLDILVNNAGGTPLVDAAIASPRLLEKIVQLNLLGPLYCAQAANRIMQQQESGGVVINIASISGTRPSPGTAVYGAAKAGLLNLTQSLAMEWGPKVRVNAVVIGLVEMDEGSEHYGGAEVRARIREILPLKRMARPEDVARTCLYLASPDAEYVSGAHIALHGGGERPAFLVAVEAARRSVRSGDLS